MSAMQLAFWIMGGVMWIVFTPSMVSVINASGITGIELLLMQLVPWVVLLAIIVRIYVSLKGGIL